VDVSQPRFRILRLALHTAPARQIVHQAQAQVLLVGVLVLVLFAVSAWQVRTLRRYLALQQEAARQERLAALGEMAAVLAHEIRNPLGAIKGLAQYLAEKAAGVPRQAEMTQTIATEATRLEGLVNDLLTYARPRPPERQPVDAGRLLAQAQAMAEPAARAAGVSIAIEMRDEPLALFADPEQMQQLLGNLALNGVQAMPGGGRLRLTAARAERGRRDAGAVHIRVEDTGAGIPAEHLARVFEPFYTTRTKGTGLGLAICRRIVEAHGGTLRVERTGPTGTVILATLPQGAAA
jgi:two-component system sensor histidine kinase HydH